VWNATELAIENNLKLFDVGTTSNNPESGHYLYKSSWGGKK